MRVMELWAIVRAMLSRKETEESPEDQHVICQVSYFSSPSYSFFSPFNLLTDPLAQGKKQRLAVVRDGDMGNEESHPAGTMMSLGGRPEAEKEACGSDRG